MFTELLERPTALDARAEAQLEAVDPRTTPERRRFLLSFIWSQR